MLCLSFLLVTGCSLPPLALVRPPVRPPAEKVAVQSPAEETVRVPLLSGGHADVPLSRLGGLKAIQWAMVLDFYPTERNRQLYEQQCRQNPQLAGEVERYWRIQSQLQHARQSGLRQAVGTRRLFR